MELYLHNFLSDRRLWDVCQTNFAGLKVASRRERGAVLQNIIISIIAITFDISKFCDTFLAVFSDNIMIYHF